MKTHQKSAHTAQDLLERLFKWTECSSLHLQSEQPVAKMNLILLSSLFQGGVPHRLQLPAGWKNASTRTLTVVCFKFLVKSSSFVNGNIGILLRYVLGCRKKQFKSALSFGEVNQPSSTGLLPCGSCAKWKLDTVAQKKSRQPILSCLPDVHKTQDVCELGATVLPFVWSLFGAASRPKPCR